MNPYKVSDQNLSLQAKFFIDRKISTESCGLDMEYNPKENEAETLKQNVCNMLQKYLI